jgi:hypothetical protein
MKLYVDSAVNTHIFGETGNGGDFLKLWTSNTDADIAYNREF